MGFRSLVSLLPAIQARRLLALALAGLTNFPLNAPALAGRTLNPTARTLLSTLRRVDCSTPRKTRFRDGWPSFPARVKISAGSLRKVSGYSAHTILLPQAFLAHPIF